MNVQNDSAGTFHTSTLSTSLFVQQVDDRLTRAVSGIRLLETGARHAVFSGGKRARPLLCQRFATLTHPEPAALIDAAAALELIHAASLVHDDILDRGEKRRGLPTVRVLLGPEAAVLSGDLLLCRALKLLAPYPHEIARAASTFEEICHAATVEWQSRRNLSFSIAAWRSMAEGKTGALFGLAGYFAASLAGDLPRAQRFDQAARALGLAFQMADDFSDLVDAGGEDLARDLCDGNPSLPILLAQAADPSLPASLAQFWAAPDQDPMPLVGRIATPAVRAEVRRCVHEEIARAEAILGADADAPSLRPLFGWARALAPATPEDAAVAEPQRLA